MTLPAFPSIISVGIIVGLSGLGILSGQADPEIPGLPSPVTPGHFGAMSESSPFFRSVELADSIVLTGVAKIEDELFASLIDTETSESYLVSELTNPQGWQLIEVRGDKSDLETLTAKIQVAAGDVISIRYDKAAVKAVASRPGGSGRSGPVNLTSEQQSEARKAAYRYREGFSADGYRREPPPEMVRKLSRISVQQREAINRKMIDLRNKGLGRDERRKIYEDTVDKSLQERR